MTKYILVAGGVISGIGKGVIASSTALLLKQYGLRVTAIKIDPYLNIDAGTLSPLDHGEVFVLDDGGEVDLDLGNYERFLDINLSKQHNITTGKIYQKVVDCERRGDFAGKTVQVVPHVTDAIQHWITKVAMIPVDESKYSPDVCIIELGGTVGDIESAPFIEAMRQLRNKVGPQNMAVILVSLVPVIGSVGEQKSKPTQHCVALLRGTGLQPDIIACRASNKLCDQVKEKISLFCQVKTESVLSVHDCKSVYHVPLLMEEQGLITTLGKMLDLQSVLANRVSLESALAVSARSSALLQEWKEFADSLGTDRPAVTIVVVGKYTNLADSYLSVTKALEHASIKLGYKIKIEMIEATDLEGAKSATAYSKLTTAHGIVVPGGFGVRGIEGKIIAAKYARENKIPFLGLCLGMQVAVIEYLRNVCGVEKANSEEFEKDVDMTAHAVVNMPEIPLDQLGGTMRLGLRKTDFDETLILKSGAKSQVKALYGGVDSIQERHRHRFEVNPLYIDRLEAAGMFFTGRDNLGKRMEIFELASTVHPFYVGTQYHPEYKTRPLRPSPPFLGLIKAASLNIK